MKGGRGVFDPRQPTCVVRRTGFASRKVGGCGSAPVAPIETVAPVVTVAGEIRVLGRFAKCEGVSEQESLVAMAKMRR